MNMMNYTWKVITKIELSSHFKDGLWYDEIGSLYGITGRAVRDKVKKFNIDVPRKNERKIIKELPKHKCKICGKEFSSNSTEYCSSSCKQLETSLIGVEELEIPETGFGKQIVELRKQGKSYSQIASELGCVKSSVAYYCNKTTKQKINDRVNRYKKECSGWFYFGKQVTDFKQRIKGIGKPEKCKDWNKKLRTAVSNFKSSNMKQNELLEYSYKDALNHLGGMKTKCYLTGDNIDIEKDNFNLDHILPLDKGGSNELSNMGITTPSANASKTNLTVEEYLELCKKSTN